VAIVGIGSAFPQQQITPQDFEHYALRHYPLTPALQKTLAINRSTGITKRSISLPLTSPHLSSSSPKLIEASTDLFLSLGVSLGTSAARAAISSWAGNISQITHLVCVTVCCSSNPGYDQYIATSLSLSSSVQRTLLHGLGCAGGVALLRHAAQLALAAHACGKQANILCVASECASLFYRSALERLVLLGEANPAVTLFGDGAGAVVSSPPWKPIYTIKAYSSVLLPSSAQDLAVPLTSTGYTALLSRRVPALASSSLLPLLQALLTALGSPTPPEQLDWALHPGGAAVLRAVQDTLGLGRERMRASWEVYGERGNCASATVLAVLERMRGWGGEGGSEGKGSKRKEVLCTAFGPGVLVEMMMLHR
ncbi:hypothetical protein DACRYDRAFT_35127, partial [Dacryopinax primogenitus]